ncbi:MarR family winged helix-turn-helix transcriptional regulator [Sediminibacillus albus]|uniref:DNA-binding transcriptional regulator, MarR family n=1 Tax=Sediminibacillus albus TaxID=407036 RepID=A0A1G9DA02_9BACI|nr:MarR family transcriptional regulator [Sediminibacillus albus]SDK60615.1 DNA-binding transcriptional regulator, MarR family [Sediminibacillus albus]
MQDIEKIEKIISSFREVNKVFYKQAWQNANDLGVTTLQLQILKLLEERPSLGLVEVASKLNNSKSTISGTVERLVKAGYVQRKRSDQDRRALVLTLTDLGLRKKQEAYRHYLERLDGLKTIDEQDAEKLIELHGLVLSKIKLDGDE